MRLERPVQRWQEVGIIDATTAERIIAHERRSSRPVLLLAIGGLGAFTIGVGLISVIAANWGDIPRLVKLLAMLGLFGANAYGLVWARGQQYRSVPYNCCQCSYSAIEGIRDGVSLYSPSLDCLIQLHTVFEVLRACYAVLCRRARL